MALKKAKDDGVKQGIEYRTKEMAKLMKSQGVSINIIVSTSGLSKEFIESL